MIFSDTSMVAKFYVAEAESKEVRALFENEDQRFVSELVRVELMGIFHRQVREKIWPRTKFETAVRQFNMDDIGGFWTWIPLDPEILEAAAKTYATLPETVYLRSADCLHLITGIHNNFPEIYTYDKHQALAAPTLGLKALKA
ncbi:MAG: type II toxin-antitoxin system VapC family toxin [Lacunisphaera sp.]|nr:type II toxin-antitoxin system VapC family toxin [Lacunisphaera sp.]